MQLPEIPENEKQRLSALNEYLILDTVEEKDYDEITALASFICDTPISLVSLIDDHRQWFKSHFGLQVHETQKEVAFCAHAINQPNHPFIINDARKDQRFFDNPLVTDAPNVIFYAGIPLVTQDGYPLGTLCVIDNKPKELNEKQLEALKMLANQLMKLLELRKKSNFLQQANVEIQVKNEALEKFARVAAHDMKSPLSNIIMLVELLEMNCKTHLDKDGQSLFDEIKDAAFNLTDIIQGILEYSKSSNYLKEQKQTVNLLDTVKEILKLSFTTVEMLLNIDVDTHISLYTNPIALKQILLNLISNAIKYNDKDRPEITISAHESKEVLCISIKDNGIGIAKEDLDRIFNLFETLVQQDRFGAKGTGIGLPTVKSLVDAMGGTIALKSIVGEGSEFKICFPKE